MTTSRSPLSAVKAQADHIAKTIKAAGRGEPIAPEFKAKLDAARAKDSFVVGILMDDKVIKMTLPWALIEAYSEVALAAYILKHMRAEQSH